MCLQSHKFQYMLYIFGVILFLSILSILFYFPNYKSYKLPLPIQAGTIPVESMKNVLEEKIKYIKENSGVLMPYNKNAMNVIEEGAKNADTYNKINALHVLLPNHDLGTYPMIPLKNPEDSTIFQFEQGNMGWYWGYATYPSASIMFYVMRADIANKDIRDKLKLKIGEGTVYYVSAGVGIDGEWHYTDYEVMQGMYIASTPSTFAFGGKTDNLDCHFMSSKLGQFQLTINWVDKDGNKFGFDTEFFSQISPYFNMPNGCAPCLLGLGTMYWSYTQLYFRNTTITFKGVDKNPGEVGVGWMDRQWGGDPGKSRIVNMMNSINRTKQNVGGLGRYVWINLHLPGNIQYMAWSFVDPDLVIKEGVTYKKSYANLYSTHLREPKWLTDAKITIKKTWTQPDTNTVYPIVYEVIVSDADGNKHTYIVDSQKYGKTVTIDPSSNYHWAGSATVSENGKEVGTGFMEANQFDTEKQYYQNVLKAAGIDPENVVYFSGKTISTSQVILPIIILYFLVILFVMLVGFGIYFIIRKVRK